MIDTAEMLKVYQHHRGDAIFVTGRGGKYWVDISTRPGRDLTLGDPAMGGHASFAFGLALAQPQHKVVFFDSEGDLLMSLGSLATIAEFKPKNFYHFLLDNECYATTGGQPVPNAKNVKYDALALAAGYPRAYAYDNLESFSVNIARILSEPGPVFTALKVTPAIQNDPIGRRKPWMNRTRIQQLKDLEKELGIVR